MLEIQTLSHQYKVRKLQANDLEDLLQLCLGNVKYYEYYKEAPTKENLKESMMQVPPHKTLDDKYFVGFYEKDTLIGVLDLVEGFPTEHTAYIGWFMIAVDSQHRGSGTFLIQEVIKALNQTHLTTIELAYIKENKEAERFWVKNGFVPIGEVGQALMTLIKMRYEIDKER